MYVLLKHGPVMLGPSLPTRVNDFQWGQKRGTAPGSPIPNQTGGEREFPILTGWENQQKLLRRGASGKGTIQGKELTSGSDPLPEQH